MSRVLASIAAAVLLGFSYSSCHAEVYYAEIVRPLDGVSASEISEAWKQHTAIWEKQGYDPTATVLRVRTAGEQPFRTYYFHFRAKDHAELGKTLERLLTDPEWSKMVTRWDELRVIMSSDIYQSVE